jgi:hypothetical protein
LEQADDEGQTDAEGAGDLAERAFVMIDRRRDSRAEIPRIGAHGRQLLPLLAPHPEMSPYWDYSRMQPNGKPL